MMKTNITLLFAFLFTILICTSTYAFEHELEEDLQEISDADHIAAVGELALLPKPIKCGKIKYLKGTICENLTFLTKRVEDLETNVFVEGVLTRLLDGACAACKAGDFRRQRFYTRIFSRYLRYIRNVDRCDRRDLQVWVSRSKPCRMRRSLDVLDDQVIVALEQQLSVVQDGRSLEEQSEHLIDVLDKVQTGHIATVEDLELRVIPCRYPQPLKGSICDNLSFLKDNVEDLGTNVFVEGVLTRLLDGACAACKAGDFRRQRFYTRMFSRYLRYIRNVDRCDRMNLQVWVSGSRPCRRRRSLDVLDDQVIVALEQQLSVVQDGRSLEEQSEHLIDVLDEMRVVSSVPAKTLTVYPNPTSAMVSLSQPAVEVHVMSSTGQVLLTRYGVQELNLEQLPIGIYTLRIRDAEDKMTSLRIVKN